MNGRIREVDPKLNEQRKIVDAAFLGIATVALTQLINAPAITTPLRAATHFFALSIPLLAFDLYATATESLDTVTIRTWYRVLMRFTGWLLSTCGIASLFWHFGKIIGLTFIISSAFSLLFWKQYYRQLDAVQRSKRESLGEAESTKQLR